MLINGGHRVVGKIRVSGAKNAALPLMVSSLLCSGTLKLYNIPNVVDITTLLQLLRHLGVRVRLDGDLSNRNNSKVIELTGANLSGYNAPYSIVSRMRATFIVLGPLLARFGRAEVSLPGGCAIGARPVDIHTAAFEQMGADLKIEDGYVKAVVKGGKLKGADITCRKSSVTATEDIMMGACLAEGTTRIFNAAMEPEVVDLANCLNAMGAKISGIGTEVVEIIGVDELHSAEYFTMSDRIEAATYMVAAVMTDGELVIEGLDFFNTLECFINVLYDVGAEIEKIDERTVRVKRKRKLSPTNVITAPYPGFPTDLQAQIVALLSMVDGVSTVDETIFENRFMHVPELSRMGANITLSGNRATINGKDGCYKGAQVMATDLRASVSLVLAGLCARGETSLTRMYHLERGFEFLADKLNACGADIKVMYDGS